MSAFEHVEKIVNSYKPKFVDFDPYEFEDVCPVVVSVLFSDVYSIEEAYNKIIDLVSDLDDDNVDPNEGVKATSFTFDLSKAECSATITVPVLRQAV